MRLIWIPWVRSGLIVVGFAALSAAHTARADDFAGDVPDLIWIDVGGEANDVTTNVGVQGPRGIGATINFEDAFDLPGHKTTAAMFGSWRIAPQRHHIDFGYVDIGRSGSRVLDEDVTFADYTFHAGGEVHSRFATQFAYAAYRYEFLHEEKVRISGTGGATLIRLVTELTGQEGFVTDPDGNPVPNTALGREASGAAPMPMFGLNLDWALARRLVLRTYTRFFYLNVDKFEGGLQQSGIHLNWYFVKHFGLGLGIDRTDLNLKELKVGQGNIAKAGYNVTGVGIFATLAW